MIRLRTFAIAAIAAATVTIGSLASAPSASAMTMTCQQRYTSYVAYWAYGMALYNGGQYALAFYWFGKGEGLMEGCY